MYCRGESGETNKKSFFGNLFTRNHYFNDLPNANYKSELGNSFLTHKLLSVDLQKDTARKISEVI